MSCPSFVPSSHSLPKRLSRGYTLIELLIVITLTAMLITFGVSAYRRAADIQAIKSNTESLLQALTAAQKAATTGRADCAGRYLGETVTTVANSTSLTTTATCDGGSGTVRTVTLSGFHFLSSQSLTFRPLSQGIDTGATDTFNLDYSNGTTTHRIQVTRGGTIQALGRISP